MVNAGSRWEQQRHRLPRRHQVSLGLSTGTLAPELPFRCADDLVLTTGVRGVVKQFYLFLRKADRANGNLSLASRSLAPPGYSAYSASKRRASPSELFTRSRA